MAALDKQWHLTQSGNYEILAEWLGLAVKFGYTPAFDRLKSFLCEVGRTRMLRHLYAELIKTEAGKKMAQEIYATARYGYHPMTQTVVEKILSRTANPT